MCRGRETELQILSIVVFGTRMGCNTNRDCCPGNIIYGRSFISVYESVNLKGYQKVQETQFGVTFIQRQHTSSSDAYISHKLQFLQSTPQHKE